MRHGASFWKRHADRYSATNGRALICVSAGGNIEDWGRTVKRGKVFTREQCSRVNSYLRSIFIPAFNSISANSSS